MEWTLGLAEMGKGSPGGRTQPLQPQIPTGTRAVGAGHCWHVVGAWVSPANLDWRHTTPPNLTHTSSRPSRTLPPRGEHLVRSSRTWGVTGPRPYLGGGTIHESVGWVLGG